MGKNSEIKVNKRQKETETSKKSQRQPSAKAQAIRAASGVDPRKVSDSIQQLSPAAMRLVRDSYNLLDSNGTGHVSHTAVKDMMLSLGLSGDNVDQMMERMGDTKEFTFANYLVVMSPLVRDLPSEPELLEMFSAFNNQEGELNVNELRAALVGQGLSAEEIELFFSKFGKSSLGKLQLDTKAYAATMGV